MTDDKYCGKCGTNLNAWPHHTAPICPQCISYDRLAKERENDQILRDIGKIMTNSQDLKGLTRKQIFEGVKRLAWETKMKREGWRKISQGWQHTTAVNTSGFLIVDEETADEHYDMGTTPPPF